MADNTAKKKPGRPAKAEKETEELLDMPEVEEETDAAEAVEKENTAKEANGDILAMYEAQMKEMGRQMEEMRRQMEEMQKPQIIQVAASTEKVHFLWQAEVADDNVVHFGEGGVFGRVVGKTGTVTVPKSELSRMLDAMTRLFIDRRWLIVLSGLSEEEREAMGVDYKEGEILDKGAFGKLVEMGKAVLDIYPQLCKGHKEIVAKRFHEAWEKGDKHVTRELVVELNRLSKEAGSEKGDFIAIIEAMNEKDAE